MRGVSTVSTNDRYYNCPTFYLRKFICRSSSGFLPFSHLCYTLDITFRDFNNTLLSYVEVGLISRTCHPVCIVLSLFYKRPVCTSAINRFSVSSFPIYGKVYRTPFFVNPVYLRNHPSPFVCFIRYYTLVLALDGHNIYPLFIQKME